MKPEKYYESDDVDLEDEEAWAYATATEERWELENDR